MEKTTVYMTPETKRRLEGLARRSGRPQAELIREAMEEFLDRNEPERPLPSFVGSVSVGGDIANEIHGIRRQWSRELSEKQERISRDRAKRTSGGER